MDHILASEILVVVLQKPGGLTFGEFRKLFCSTHGYPLDLSRYGYSSIQRLLDGMRDLVAVVEEAAQEPLITCISHAQHQHVFLGESELTSEEWLHSAQVLEDSTTGKQARIQEVSELLSSCLDAFPTGLKLRKMKEVMKKEHGTDLEALRKDLGCADVRHLLHLLPNIRLLNPSKPSNCVVQLQEGLRGTPASLRSSQSSIASGFQTPTEGRETDAGECGKDTSDEAASEYLQQPSIHHAGPTKPNSCAVHLQEGIQKVLALANSALSGFPLGMKIRKLKDAVMKEHGIDLEEFSKGLGYKDLVDCLQQQPNIKLVAPAKLSNCIVQLQEAGGYQNLPGGEEPSRNITAPTVASNQRTSKLQSDELHNQVSSQALLHNTPGSPSLHNDWDGLLDSRGPEQPPGHPIVLTKNTNSQLDSSTPNGPSEQIPGRKPPSTQPSQQKQETHVIKNAPEQSSEIATPKANSRMQQLWHLPAHIAKPQKAAILYSDIVSRSTQVAPSRISTSTNLPASSSCSSQSSGMSLQASSTVHYSTTQLPIPTSARQHTAAETQRGFGSSSETGEELSETSKQGPKSIEELKRNILHVLVQHPNGMTLFQFQNTYSFTFQHRIPLQGHQNMKQLLATMPDAVKTRGLGAQMLVFPYGSQVPPTSVILEENGFKLLETETEPHPTEHGAVLSNINLSAKTPPALNPSLTALKEEDTGAVPSCSSKPPAACMRTSHALDPEAAIFSLPSPVCSPQLPSVVHNGVSASFSEDITGYDYHVPEGSHVPALSQKLISDSSTPSDADSVDISTSPPVFATDSFMNPSSLADLKEPAVSPPCQNGWASSEHLPPNGIRNLHARNCSHAAQFEDNALPTSSQNLLAPGRETEMGTDPGASKTTPQESATIALRRSKTKAPVQFVVSFPDSFNKDLNREMFIYGSSGEKPTFGTVDFPKL